MEKNTRKIELIFLLIVGALLISTTSMLASGRKLIKEKSFATQPGKTLTVDASGADVSVQTWDKNEAYVKIFANSKAEEKMHFEIESNDDGIKVIAKKKGSSWFSFWNWGGGMDVRIVVLLPVNYNTDIETSGGDINLSNSKGNNNLHTSGGDVTLNSTAGDLYVETSGGDIKLKDQLGDSRITTSGGDITTINFKGNLKASTSGGDINVEATDGKILAKTSGGDIDLSYDGVNKGIEAYTSGGSIRVKLPSTFKANVFLETSGGEIESNFTNSRANKVTRSSLKADYNGGGESLVLKTSGGDIVVNQK